MASRSPQLILGALGALGLALFGWVLTRSGHAAPLLLLGLLGTAVVFLLLDRPHLGVFAIFLVWFADISSGLLGSRFLAIPYLVSVILAVPLGLAITRERDIWVLRTPQVRILLGIALLYLVSTVWSSIVRPPQVEVLDETERQFTLFFARLLFVVFLGYFAATRKQIETFLFLFVAVTVLVAIESWGMILDGTAKRAQAALLEMQPNRLPFACLFATAILWFYRTHLGRGRYWTIPFLLGFSATALASGSRSGLLQAIALGVVVLLDRGRRGLADRRLGRLMIVLAAVAFLVSVVPSTLLERATTFDPSAASPGQWSLQNRLRQLHSALILIAENPLVGVGIGNFESIARARFALYGGTHNSYLLALTEGGIGVLILYLGLIAVTYRMLVWVERNGGEDLLWIAKSLRVGLLLFAISAATGDIWMSENLYLILGLTIVVVRLADPTIWRSRWVQGAAEARSRYPVTARTVMQS